MKRISCGIVTVVCLLAVFLMESRAMATDVYDLVLKGGELSASQAATLEKNLEQTPDDVEKRTILLGYYLTNHRQDQDLRKNRIAHVLWLIKNAPEAEVLLTPYGGLDPISDKQAYGQAKKLWIDKLKANPENLVVLEHTAQFFLLFDPELAKKSLEKGRELQPKDPKWPSALGQLYSLQMHRSLGKAKLKAAVKALEQLEIAYDLSDEESLDHQHASLAKAALAAKDTVKARKHAMKMLEPKNGQNTEDWNSGNNIHDGNSILGQIALLSDDVKEAKRRLLEAGKTYGSPQLDSFGPNMILANELIKRGEKETVLEYFELCSKFWKMGGDRLKEWSAQVKDGKRPAFGGNLRY